MRIVVNVAPSLYVQPMARIAKGYCVSKHRLRWSKEPSTEKRATFPRVLERGHQCAFHGVSAFATTFVATQEQPPWVA